MSNSRNNSDAHIGLKIQQQLNINVLSGLITGVFCSGLFNPWDRALYLSVINRRAFLSGDNFRLPYQGFSQAVIQRAFLGSIYYIAQGQLKEYLHPYLHNELGVREPTAQFCIGLSAGSMSGVLTNSISAIKYHTWGGGHRSFCSSLGEMWSQGRYKPFIKGTTATIARDMTFGSTYEVLRHLLRPANSSTASNPYVALICNAAAAGVATMTSGPLNYVRSIQYATPPDRKPPGVWKALQDVWQEAKYYAHEPFGRLRFFQQQFRVGWGTARVAVGMAVGQQIFDWSRNELGKYYTNKKMNSG
jgi:hypothetical protein